MARIPYPDPEKLSEEARTVLSKLAPMNIFRMLGHAETTLRNFTRLGTSILYKLSLDPLLREMAILRVGHLSGAGYEVYQHERISRDLGMGEDKIGGLKLGADAPVFTPVEKAVLRFTDEVVHRVKASDEALARVLDFLDHRQIVELLVTIGYYMMICRFLETLEVDRERP